MVVISYANFSIHRAHHVPTMLWLWESLTPFSCSTLELSNSHDGKYYTAASSKRHNEIPQTLILHRLRLDNNPYVEELESTEGKFVCACGKVYGTSGRAHRYCSCFRQ